MNAMAKGIDSEYLLPLPIQKLEASNESRRSSFSKEQQRWFFVQFKADKRNLWIRKVVNDRSLQELKEGMDKYLEEASVRG